MTESLVINEHYYMMQHDVKDANACKMCLIRQHLGLTWTCFHTRIWQACIWNFGTTKTSYLWKLYLLFFFKVV